MRIDLLRSRRVGLDFTLEPFAGYNRETYTSHRTGLPLVVSKPHPDDPTNSSLDEIADLAHRYDTNEAGGAAEVEVAWGSTFDFSFAGRVTRVDYVEDYRELVTIDSWDNLEVRGDVDASLSLRGWIAAAGYAMRLVDYDERFPRDSSGTEVLPRDAGYEPQQFLHHHGTARAGFSGDRGRAVLRWRGTRRLDLYSGYLDYTDNRYSADLRLRFAAAETELRLEPSWTVRSYDELRVHYDPQEPVSNRERLGVEASVEWSAFSDYTRFFVGAERVSQRSANPLFTYSDTRVMTGLRVRLR